MGVREPGCNNSSGGQVIDIANNVDNAGGMIRKWSDREYEYQFDFTRCSAETGAVYILLFLSFVTRRR